MTADTPAIPEGAPSEATPLTAEIRRKYDELAEAVEMSPAEIRAVNPDLYAVLDRLDFVESENARLREELAEAKALYERENLCGDRLYAERESARREPTDWIHMSRGFGAFMPLAGAIERENARQSVAALLSAIARLEDDKARLAEELSEVERLPGFDHNDALQILCRAFDNWEPMYDEWLDWYKPTDWIHMSRGFGAFMRGKIAARFESDEINDLRASITARYETIRKLHDENTDLRRELDALREVVRYNSVAAMNPTGYAARLSVEEPR